MRKFAWIVDNHVKSIIYSHLLPIQNHVEVTNMEEPEKGSFWNGETFVAPQPKTCDVIDFDEEKTLCHITHTSTVTVVGKSTENDIDAEIILLDSSGEKQRLPVTTSDGEFRATFSLSQPGDYQLTHTGRTHIQHIRVI